MSEAAGPGELDGARLERLARAATEHGLLRLGAVDLEHPGFALARAALDAHLDAGRHGEMEFMARTRAVRKEPAQMLDGARTVLVALVPYAGVSGPIARYAQWADYHTVIHRRWNEFLPALEAELPGVRSLVCVDTKPLMERAAAVLAGLGFLGKNGMLIAPGLGSYVSLGALLIDAPYVGEELAPDWASAPSTSDASAPWDACGSCRRCLDACPTQAFVAPGHLDARRCISYLTIESRAPAPAELEAAIGERVAGCDVCQEVCPYNAGEAREARAPAQAWLPSPPPGRDRSPDLVKLANIGNNQHRGFVRHTALNRIPRRALRRNAIVALGNKEGPLAAEARAALEQAAAGDDPLTRDAALRALRRRGA